MSLTWEEYHVVPISHLL